MLSLLSAVLVLSSVLATRAEPIPLVRRVDPIDSATSVWYPALTSHASEWYSIATAEASSWASVGMSYASAGASDASTWMVAHGFTTVTTDSVFTTVASSAGVPETITTSVPVTLTSPTSGVVTTVGSSQFTVVPTSTSTSNGATHLRPLPWTFTPALTALLTLVGGTLLGACIAF